MKLKVSDRYQVVIPKKARETIRIDRHNSYMTVKKVTENEITYALVTDIEAHIEKYAGTLKNTAWQKSGMDAAKWIRKSRDQDWD